MKYIIFDNRYPIIFPQFLVHSETASLHRRLGKPTSAGFIRMESTGTETKLYPYGSSLSLNLVSEPGDSDIINKALEQLP